MMKRNRIFSLALAGAMSLSLLAACGDKKPSAPSETPKPSQTTQQPAQQPTQQPTQGKPVEVPAYIANATDADFKEIYLSVSGDDEWGENLLADDEHLPSGNIMPVTLEIADREGVKWDLRVVDPNGDSLEWNELDISQMPTSGFAIELMWDGENGTAKLAETPDQLEGKYTKK